ncbi:MAG: hypothetical protein M1834_004947 [Cirrosporium novae-zelandiae]|nr:MAG: hypothetical protein M1834_004947 [Cirrosporium novae-zelandiae]
MPSNHFQLVFIGGGSRGLGKDLAILLVKKGANVVIFSRSQPALDAAKSEIQQARKSPSQTIDTISVDLSDANDVDRILKEYNAIPDILICVAGGSPPSQINFLAELSPDAIRACMDMNYYTSVFITRAVIKLWLQNPAPADMKEPRHVVFTSSSAAFVGLPGYAAYTTPKVAIRALADTLRQELLLYGNTSKYQVHCSFPGTFITDSFLEEQSTKPTLLKSFEGSQGTEEELRKRLDSSMVIAGKIVRGLERGEFFITTDLQGAVLLGNMRGPSPRNYWVWDTLMGGLGMLVWPWVRWGFDGRTVEFGREGRKEGKYGE